LKKSERHRSLETRGKRKRTKGRLKELFNKKELQKQARISARFLAVFLLSFFVIYTLISFLPVELFEHFTALLCAFAFSLFGYSSNIILGEPVQILVNGKYLIEISYLCTGLLESTIITSAILASFGISIRKRVVGILAGIFFVNFLNVLRIALTVHAIVTSQNVAYIDFIHNFLFRLTLFVGIACYYAAWFLLATSNPKLNLCTKKSKKH